MSGIDRFSLSFGTDGVRAEALTVLTPEFAMELGRVLADVLYASHVGDQRIFIGHDPRESAPVLEAALSAGLAAQGVAVELLGMMPTPAIAALSAEHGIPGVVITASHNLYSDNGIKVFASGGHKLSDDMQSAIEAKLRNGNTRSLSAPGQPTPGSITRRDDVSWSYSDHLVDMFGEGALSGMRIVIDAANGAMSVVAPLVFERLGADVVVMNVAPSGTNINDACGATAPEGLCAFIADAHDGLEVDLGFAFDGDGDRVIAVDDLGQVVDGDRLLALSALERLGSGTLIGGTVVVTVMTNLGFHRAMHAAGIDVVTTPVGDRSVLRAMEEGGFVVGGEQSGHIIHRDLATTGDGLLAAIILARLSRREKEFHGRTFSELARAVMTTLPQILRAVPIETRALDIERELAVDITAAREALGTMGRVLVRMSGTEPVVRVMVEAESEDTAQSIADDLVRAVQLRWGTA